MTVPVGVILAGGQARRMGGGDKALLALGGIALLEHVSRRFAPQVAQLALSANGDPGRFGSDLPVLPDPVAGFAGPLAGVLAGLDWAARLGASHLVSAAVDTPFLPRDLVDRLIGAARGAGRPIALAASGSPPRPQPTFGLWPVALRDDLRAALETGTRKILDWTDRHGAAMAAFAADPLDPFFNINRPRDLTRAEAILKGGAP